MEKPVRNLARAVAWVVVTALVPTVSAASSGLLERAAQSLIARSTPARWLKRSPSGWAWRSVIQAPNDQTDRDVGAASVGMGLIAAYDVTGNKGYLAAAQRAGDFLIAAEVPARSGRWPDYFNPDGPAPTGFTSFDDGAAGIGDFLWRLYERTGAPGERTAALAAEDFEVSHARAPAGARCPEQQCFWPWRNPATTTIYTGMGEGVAGIAWTLETFSRRLAAEDPIRARGYHRYAMAAAAWLESQMVRDEAGARIPERPGTRVFDTGYLSGSAGQAFLFFYLHQTTGERRFLEDAKALLAWVEAQALVDAPCAGLKWPIQTSGAGARRYATGIEEGNAGIGWVALQARQALLVSDAKAADAALALAKSAGDWLLSPCVARREAGGLYWPEDEGRDLVHTSLDNGAPGIAIFLGDLALASGDARYHDAAMDARRWVESVAFHDALGNYWCEHRIDGRWRLCAEPSWHWGAAGILDMAARLAGWRLDIPGEQPGLAGPSW